MEKKSKSRPKRYCVRVDIGTDPETGQRLRKAIYAKTKREAREKAAEYKAALRSGVDIVQANATLSDWIDRWLSVYGQRAGWSQNKRIAIDCELLRAALGDMPLRDIRPIHLQEYADKRAARAASTVSKTKGTVNQIFRDAVANRVIAYDPAVGVRWSYAGSGTHRLLERWEIALISQHYDEHRTGVWAMLMLYAGLRRGEALALRWEDIDWAHNIIHVRGALHFEGGKPVIGSGKTANAVRDVPMFPALRKCLQSAERAGEYICCSAAGTIVTDCVWASSWKTFHRVMTRALNGPDGDTHLEFSVRAHDLRHTFCSLLYAAGVDVLSAQRLMGHASPDITLGIYTHLSEDKHALDVQKALDYMDEMAAGFDAHIDAQLRNNTRKSAKNGRKTLNIASSAVAKKKP